MIPIDTRDARFIRLLRKDLDLPWSRIGELWQAQFGQLFGASAFESGAQLCEWAASTLGESGTWD